MLSPQPPTQLSFTRKNENESICTKCFATVRSFPDEHLSYAEQRHVSECRGTEDEAFFDAAARPSPAKGELFVCWKEIAAFFGKGVRTVQRWEKLGMPVHRPAADHSVVFADPEELKRWALQTRDDAGTGETDQASHS